MSKIIIIAIQIYQRFKNGLNYLILPLFGVAFACRQQPSCSQFTIMKIKEHGTIWGLFLGLKRVSQCH